ASVQKGATGVGEYRVALATDAASLSNAPSFSVAVTNGALANYGFERYLDAPGVPDASWSNPDGDSGINKGSRVNLGTTEEPNLIYPVAEGTNSYYLREYKAGNNYPKMSQIIPFAASDSDQTLTVDLTLKIFKRAADSIVYAKFEFSADEVNWTPAVNDDVQVGEGADAKETWVEKTMATKTLTAAAGMKYLRFTLYSNSGTANIDDVRLSVRVGAAPAKGTADRATMRYVADAAAQGLNVKYLFAADADNDRAQDRRIGGTATFYTAYDCTPPTPVKFGTSSSGTSAHSAGASTEKVDDPMTQFDLKWYAADVGPDNPEDSSHYQESWGGNKNVLSPWETYKVYYKEYDADEAERHTGYANSDSFIFQSILDNGNADLSGEGWTNVTKATSIADTSHGTFNYDGMGNVETKGIRLFDLDFDKHYVVVVVGVDKAGNEGPFNDLSWATNNTIKFALTQGVVRASTFINAMLPTDSTDLENVKMSRIADTSAKPQGAMLYWLAVGQDAKTGAFKEGGVTKEYDLIFRDARAFTEDGTERWALATSGSGANSGTSKTNWNYQADNFSGLGRNKLRFFRASYHDRWQDAVTNTVDGQPVVTKQTPLASEEVYAMNRVPLVEGKNLVALHGVPYTNTFAGVFGTDTSVLPAGNDITTATRVEFFDNALDQTRLDAAETYFFLKKQGDSTVGEWWGPTGVTTNEVNPESDANPWLEGWFVKSDGGEYELSKDTNVVVGTAYYKHDGADTPVVPGTDANPSVERWYESNAVSFVMSSDTNVVASKTYY
ncbi:MAG: hypothetical protein J6Y19_07785, partial [Kiritimatiellae bacterium]|nr:hypothetical protein [Kiritimatiellia bacterium]